MANAQQKNHELAKAKGLPDFVYVPVNDEDEEEEEPEEGDDGEEV